MKPTMKPQYGTTIHRDNTVSYWDVYLQQWQRTSIFSIVDKHDVFSSLPQSDRDKINAARNRLLRA